MLAGFVVGRSAGAV
jgi:hypothetical protein